MELLYFLISLGASTIGAISGIGGGVIIKPVLDATGTMSVSTISFLSGCTVLAMAIVSMIRGRNSGIVVDKKKGTSLAVGAALGGVFGKNIFEIIKHYFGNDNLVGGIQAILLLIMTVSVLLYIKKKSSIKAHTIENVMVCFIIGVALGLISAFLGIGGGPINIAVLYYFFSMDAKTAARNSIYIILFSQVTSFLSTLIQGTVPKFSPFVLVMMMVGGILGATLGGNISKKLNADKVEKIFMGLLTVIIVINIYNAFNFFMQ
ncbi:MAG: sulfite exporter TauE/SafE family protein [Cellulosilyticaceae bacterium]